MSPGPGNRQDNRQRGNAAQLLEKYKGLARDAQMQGDRVQTEYFLQYADHYFRVLGESRARFEEQRRQRGERDDDYGDDEDERELEAADNSGRDDGDDGDGREERARRFDRNDRPERPRFEREDRVDRNGEFRSGRGRGRGPRREDDDQGEERIAFDSLPPAIQPAQSANDAEDAPAPAARPRRPRRPRATDEDIAPAA